MYDMVNSEEESVCFICDKSENDASQMIECAYCNKCCHFCCKKLYGNAINRAKKKPFFCSIECIDMNNRSNQSKSDSDVDVVAELRLLTKTVLEIKQESMVSRSAFEETRLQMAASMKTMETNKHIEESQVFFGESVR